MQLFSQARVVVITDPGTGERLTLRFPSGSAYTQFVRRAGGVPAGEAAAMAVQFAASGRACLSRVARAPRRVRWATEQPSPN